MGAAGFGVLLGAIFLASRGTVLKLGRIVPAAAILFGAGLIILSFSGTFSLSLVLMVFIGLGMMLQTVASNTILQTTTDDDKGGRVISFYTMAIMGTAPFGSMMACELAKAINSGYNTSRKLLELQTLVRTIYVKMGIIPELEIGIQTALVSSC
jgi:MFS family permease